MQAANFEVRVEIMTSILDAYTNLGSVQLGKAIMATLYETCFTGPWTE